jgi:ketosteroid isomerase-like protein
MPQENVKLVQRGVEHFVATGEVLWEMIDEGVEVYDHDTPDQGPYHGHAGYARWLEDWGTAWAEWSIEPEEFTEADDSVVIFLLMKAKGRGSGIEVERQDALVYKLRNGRIVRGDYYNDREQALDSVGLAQ